VTCDLPMFVQRDGSRVIFDDYREAYWWLRQNTVRHSTGSRAGGGVWRGCASLPSAFSHPLPHPACVHPACVRVRTRCVTAGRERQHRVVVGLRCVGRRGHRGCGTVRERVSPPPPPPFLPLVLIACAQASECTAGCPSCRRRHAHPHTALPLWQSNGGHRQPHRHRGQQHVEQHPHRHHRPRTRVQRGGGVPHPHLPGRRLCADRVRCVHGHAHAAWVACGHRVGCVHAHVHAASVGGVCAHDVCVCWVRAGGMSGYGGDDINKFLWPVRIGGGVFPHIKVSPAASRLRRFVRGNSPVCHTVACAQERDFLSERGELRVDKDAGPAMHRSLMYKLSYYRCVRARIGSPVYPPCMANEPLAHARARAQVRGDASGLQHAGGVRPRTGAG
jgi:hypothetical protein